MGKNQTLSLLVVLAIAGVVLYVRDMKKPDRVREYPAPRFPKYLTKAPNDEELMDLARAAARLKGGWTKLGVAQPGDKILIVVATSQDMRVLKAVIGALKERGVEADYLFDTEFQGNQDREPRKNQVPRLDFQAAKPPGKAEGWLEAFLWGWPEFLPESEKQKVGPALANSTARGPKEGERNHREVLAVKKYLDEHPEYKYFFGKFGGVYRSYAEMELGKKYPSAFRHRTVMDLVLNARPFPNDILRLLEDRVLEIIPWIESVRVTDPEGTDFSFSVTPDEAEAWYKGAYEPGWISVSPFGGSVRAYWTEGLHKVAIPDIKGVIAGTKNHIGWYPRIKLYVDRGQVQRAEGGGKIGYYWRLYLGNEKLKQAHYPDTPNPGFFYVFEGLLGIDPTVAGGASAESPIFGRSGVMHWGFGMDAYLPEMLEYAKKNSLPFLHGMHVHLYFPTYDVRLRGSDQRLKIVEKGHLTALDDPEVVALAARYGKSDELLREQYVPAIPGINAPGDYERDYAADPLSYEKREWERIKYINEHQH